MKAGHALFFIALGLFGLYTIEFGVVGVLPAIIGRFDLGVAQAGMLVGAFALVVAATGPFSVLLASRFDRTRVLIASLLAFAACSVASAYAPNFPALLVLRLIPALLHPVFFSLAFAAAIALYPPQRAAHAASLAFVGTSMGLVLGVPLTTWVAARFSYETSFLFCAAVNAAAAAGLWRMLPRAAPTIAVSYGSQLRVLRRPALWLSAAATVTVFAAMFSVYSYAAEYLARETGLDGETTSLLLIVFGIGGVAGNLLAGKAMGRYAARTALLHPLLLAGAYGVLQRFGSAHVASMLPIMLLWGAAHTSGLIVTQLWLASTAPEAPEFATSLYISTANLGVVAGSTVGGWCIAAAGMRGALYGGWLFAALATVLVAAKVLCFGSREGAARRPAPEAADMSADCL